MSERPESATQMQDEQQNHNQEPIVGDPQPDQGQAASETSSEKKPFRFPKDMLLWIVLGILAILLILSIVVLSARLADYSKVDEREVSLSTNMDKTLDIFALEYQNDSGEVSIKGSDGEKVLAPGTDVEYTIRIRNTDKVALDFTFSPDVHYLSDIELPLEVRLIGPDEQYVIGSATEWVPMEEINVIEHKHTLLSGECVEYYFQWRWPFESGDDDYDTWLGSATLDTAVGADMSFAIHASANTDVELNGGVFGYQTPDVIYIIIFMILLIVAITLLVIIIVRKILAAKPIPDPVPEPEPQPEPEPEPKPEPVPLPMALTGKMVIINLDLLDEYFEAGSVISPLVLKQRGLLPKKAKYIKILGNLDRPLEKAWVIKTHRISEQAKQAILEAGGEVIILKD